MISILSGALMSLIANLVLIGAYFIEAIILTITYNKMGPILAENFEFTLPFDNVSIWFVWGIFILIHFIGKFIQMIVPKLFSVNK